jgi:hypothetical protein
MSLWLPILLSAVFVFIASSMIHAVLTYHYKDFKGVPEDDKLMTALRGFNLSPGEYFVPYAGTAKVRKSVEFREKMKKGPTVFMTVWESGMASMGKNLVIWFVYSVIIGIFSAYITGRALGPGASYLEVFRFAGFTAFSCYTVASWQDSIWFNRSWRRTITGTIDGLVYGLLTAGTFGWLWPH